MRKTLSLLALLIFLMSCCISASIIINVKADFAADAYMLRTVYTENLSKDDNFFYATLGLSSTSAVVGESIVLAPTSAINIVGTQHTVTAIVQDDLGNPIAGCDVDFGIVTGPTAIIPAVTVSTDINGEANFTYTGVSIGTDIIVASFVNSQGDTVTSNQVTKEWTRIDQVIPEVPLGTVVASAAMIIALVAYAAKSKWKGKQEAFNL
jgi:hypothetical protein